MKGRTIQGQVTRLRLINDRNAFKKDGLAAKALNALRARRDRYRPMYGVGLQLILLGTNHAASFCHCRGLQQHQCSYEKRQTLDGAGSHLSNVPAAASSVADKFGLSGNLIPTARENHRKSSEKTLEGEPLSPRPFRRISCSPPTHRSCATSAR